MGMDPFSSSFPLPDRGKGLKAMPQTTTPSTPHPRQFDEETYRQLDGYDIRLLEEIEFLSKLQAKKSITGAKYCCPSEIYLSKKVGIARENISRHISKLSRLGILAITHRRKLRGNWQTNMYRIVSWVWWRLRQATQTLRSLPSRVTQPSHKAISVRENEEPSRIEGSSSSIKGILTNLLARMRAGETLSEA